MFLKRQRKKYYKEKEKISDVQSVLKTWKDPSLKEIKEQIHDVFTIIYETVNKD